MNEGEERVYSEIIQAVDDMVALVEPEDYVNMKEIQNKIYYLVGCSLGTTANLDIKIDELREKLNAFLEITVEKGISDDDE